MTRPEEDSCASRPSVIYILTSATIHLLMRCSTRKFALFGAGECCYCLPYILTSFCVLYMSKNCLMFSSVCALFIHQYIYIVIVAVVQNGNDTKTPYPIWINLCRENFQIIKGTEMIPCGTMLVFYLPLI